MENLKAILAALAVASVCFSASAQTDDQCLALVDSNGERIGAAHHSANVTQTTITMNVDSVPVVLTAAANGLTV